MEITGPMLQATLITGYSATAGKLQTTDPRVPVWCPMISISFDPLWSTWLASDCHRCSHEETIYTIGIDFFYTRIQALVPFGTTVY